MNVKALKQCKLEAYIKRNLPKVLKAKSLSALGDRKQYVGSSEIGGCLRKAYLDKVRATEYDTATWIRFERGHLSEGLVSAMLTGLKMQEQVEVKALLHGFALEAHIDFMKESRHECVVVEAKSVGSPITEPYNSWIMQVQYQLHLLGLSRQKPVRAYIVAIELNNGWFKTFEVAYNESLAQMAFNNAAQLIHAIKENKEPQPQEQLYCSMCTHKADCPLMNAGAVELQGDMLQLATQLVDQKKQLDQAKTKEQATKAEIQAFMQTAKLQRVKAPNGFISLIPESSYACIDTEVLKQERPKLYEMLLSKYGIEKTRKSFLRVQ